MTSITDDTKHPNEGPKNITQTKGPWVRKNKRRQEIELWIDGTFKASWNGLELTEQISVRMMLMCIRYGEDKGREKHREDVCEILGINPALWQ